MVIEQSVERRLIREENLKFLRTESLKETLLRMISRTSTVCTRQRNLLLTVEKRRATTVLADTTRNVIQEEIVKDSWAP